MSEKLEPIKPYYKAISEVFEVKGRKYQTFLVYCPRCGGSGHYSYNQVDGTMCLKCRGAKYLKDDLRVYTEKEIEAYHKRQDKKRLEDLKKRIVRENKETLASLGFTDNKYIYVVAMDDTFNIKDEIKESGGKWSKKIAKWYFTEETDNYPTERFSSEDLTFINESGFLIEKKDVIHEIKYKKYTVSTSEYYGEVGKRYDLELTVKSVKVFTSYSSSYSWRTFMSYLVLMEDAEGNVFKWVSASDSGDLDVDKTYKIRGTVKEHTVYNGDKQTVLTRCKVEEQL